MYLPFRHEIVVLSPGPVKSAGGYRLGFEEERRPEARDLTDGAFPSHFESFKILVEQTTIALTRHAA